MQQNSWARTCSGVKFSQKHMYMHVGFVSVNLRTLGKPVGLQSLFGRRMGDPRIERY